MDLPLFVADSTSAFAFDFVLSDVAPALYVNIRQMLIPRMTVRMSVAILVGVRIVVSLFSYP